MIKGCLRGFVLGVIIITLVVIFSGGAVDLDVLFTATLLAIIIYSLLCLIVSIVKWIINKL
jgi:hypothetical protein